MKTQKEKGLCEEIFKVKWKSICEEDYTNLRESRKDKIVTPRLVYIDKHKNHYYFIKS